MERFDAIVVGLGAHGSAAAAELARRGLSVLGLERATRGETRGSSAGRSRMIRLAHYESPAYVPLARASWDAWRALEAETGTSVLTPRPGLYAGPADSVVVAGSLDAAREGAVGHEILDAATIRRRWPVFTPADDIVGVVDTGAGMLDADLAIAANLLVAARGGADLRFGAAAIDWRPAAGGGVEVQTDDGRVAGAEALVLAAGPWTSGFVPDLRLPIVVERQPVLWLEPQRASGVDELRLRDLPIWLWSTEAGTMYGFPWDDERGLKVARHHGGATVDPDAVDRTVRPADEDVVRAFVRQRMPAMDGPVRHATVCLYANTPDEEFVIDRHPAVPGVAYASACSGHGFKFAPVVGTMLADLATGRDPVIATDRFRAGRFGEPTGR